MPSQTSIKVPLKIRTCLIHVEGFKQSLFPFQSKPKPLRSHVHVSGNLINSKLHMDCSHSALKSSMASGQRAHQPDDELALAPLLLASYLAAVGDESGPGGEEPALWLVSPL